MAIPIAEDPYSSYTSNFNFWNNYDSIIDKQPPPAFYRPESLESICALTKFTKREIQIIYRSFKQGCPSGIVDLKQFQEIFCQFFPHGNPKRYAQLVFSTLDKDEDEQISFEEFVCGLSTLIRGTAAEKFGWIFSLYDAKKRGSIGPQELLIVIQSVYELLGRNTNPAVTRTQIHAHVIGIYKSMCESIDNHRWRQGGTPMEINRERFVQFCLESKTLLNSLHLFDTVL